MTGYLEGMVSVAVIEDGDASDTVTQKMMKMARVMDKAGICIWCYRKGVNDWNVEFNGERLPTLYYTDINHNIACITQQCPAIYKR